MPVVAFHGGPAHGTDMNLPEPLLHTLRYPVPLHGYDKFTNKQEIVDYHLIPSVGYFHGDHPQWKAYLQHCHEFTMAVAAEMAMEEKASKRLLRQSSP